MGLVMKAELQRMLAGTAPIVDDAWRTVVFDIHTARRALPYVSRVAHDAAASFRRAQHFVHEIQQTASSRVRLNLGEQRDAALGKLNRAIDECNTVGADLLDIPAGVVRFNAVIDGRMVSLLWRLGEPVESAWQYLLEPELDDCEPAYAAAR